MAKRKILQKLKFDGVPLARLLKSADKLSKHGKKKQAEELRFITATVLYRHVVK
jgi:hypothetical protein